MCQFSWYPLSDLEQQFTSFPCTYVCLGCITTDGELSVKIRMMQLHQQLAHPSRHQMLFDVVRASSQRISCWHDVWETVTCTKDQPNVNSWIKTIGTGSRGPERIQFFYTIRRNNHSNGFQLVWWRNECLWSYEKIKVLHFSVHELAFLKFEL